MTPSPRHPLTALLLTTAAILSACSSTKSPPNRPLNELVTTDIPANTHLSPEWAGLARDSIRTGSFTTENPAARQSDYALDFNWYIYPVNSYFQDEQTKIITQSKDGQHFSSIYTWCSTLPTDDQLTAATTLAALINLLGPSHNPTESFGSVDVVQTTAGWRFFTMASADEIETISISCTITSKGSAQESHVNGLLVVRGNASPKRGK